MTTDKNNILNNRCPPCRSGAPSGETEDVVFTSCSRCFPIDTQAIRSKILDLAMRGKLTEQLPEDGTAEELYQEIQAGKTRIIAERNGRVDKSIRAVGEDIPYLIPAHWKWIRFGDVGLFKKGPFGSALTKAMFVPKSENAVKVYEQQHAIKKNPALGTYYISKDYFRDKLKGFEVKSGDILISCAGTIGETYVLPDEIEPGIINQALMRVTLVPGVDNKFFQYYFESELKNSAKAGNGSAIVNIPPFDVIKNWYFPLPSLAEQQRVVERIEQAFSVLDTIDALQAQYADNLTALKSKLLEAAVQGQLVPRGPEPWETVKLGDIAESVNVGIVIRPTRYYVPPGEGTPAFRNCNIQQGFMDDGEWVWLNPDAARENPRAVVKTGDILIARSGTPGNCCLVPEACDGWGAVDIVIVRLRQDQAAPRYVKAFICSPTAQKAFMSMSRGVALTHLGATAVASLPISLPPLAEQCRIVAKLDEVLEMIGQTPLRALREKN